MIFYSTRPSHYFYLTGIITFVTITSIVLLPRWTDHPFPTPSLLHTASKSSADPRWLLAVFLGPSNLSRRHIIRSTWATRYTNPSYEYRFILGNYSSTPWAPIIDAENATYGDIWSIPDFMNESDKTANKIKNLELFKDMAENQGSRVRRYDFVSKVDSDVWLNTPQYFDTFVAPRLAGGEKYDPDALVMIGRPMVWECPYVFASGRLYTMSWPLIEFLAQKYTAKPHPELNEDVAVGLYLYEDRTNHTFVPVEVEQAWDIGLEYLVDNETMIMHGIKEDERLVEISAIFDERGVWNGKQIPGLTGQYNRTIEEAVKRIGEPTDEEMKRLKKGWENSNNEVDPKDTEDWRLIEEKISIEDREAMGGIWPMSLPGNNISTGIVPQLLGKVKFFSSG